MRTRPPELACWQAIGPFIVIPPVLVLLSFGAIRTDWLRTLPPAVEATLIGLAVLCTVACCLYCVIIYRARQQAIWQIAPGERVATPVAAAGKLPGVVGPVDLLSVAIRKKRIVLTGRYQKTGAPWERLLWNAALINPTDAPDHIRLACVANSLAQILGLSAQKAGSKE